MQTGLQRDEIRPLTGLRFLAALYVFLFHIQIRWPLPVSGFWSHVLGNGSAGMSLFFVLSGYVLAYRYSGAPIDNRAYAWNRIGRIYPVYVVAAALTLPFLVLNLQGKPHLLAKALSLAVADLTLTQAWIAPSFDYWNNMASWSISCEAFFYALFPAILPLLLRVKRPWLLAIPMYLITLMSGLAFHAFREADPAGLGFYQLPLFRMGEFVLGILAYIVGSQWSGKRADLVFAGAVITLIVGMGLRTAPEIIISANWLVVPAMAAIVTSAARSQGLLARFLGSAPMEWLGRVSYGFYSFQALVLLTLMHYRAVWSWEREPTVVLSAAFVSLLAISAFSYHLLEEPARRWVSSLGRRRAPGTSQEAPRSQAAARA